MLVKWEGIVIVTDEKLADRCPLLQGFRLTAHIYPFCFYYTPVSRFNGYAFLSAHFQRE